jgi:hypothetical protein
VKPSRWRRSSFAAGIVAVVVSLSGTARADDPAQLEARTLFTAGNAHLQDGDYVDALNLFRAAYARYPSAKILINIGTTLRHLGRYAEAADAYDAYLHDPAAEASKKAEIAKALADLDARVGKATVAVEGGAAQIRVDGKPLGKPADGAVVRLDPGPHVISAERDGATIASQNVSAAPGEQLNVTLRAVPVPANTPAPPPPPPVAAPPPPADTPTPPPPPKDKSHRWQLGAILRADIDGMRPGVVPAFGLAFGLGDYVEINASGLVGRNKGVEPGATVLILKGTWKPRISVGAPIFIADGVHPGVRAAAGVQFDPIRYFGAFVELGAAAFPNAPAGYDKVVFLPTVGVEPRIF